jgi:hypothetical protein
MGSCNWNYSFWQFCTCTTIISNFMMGWTNPQKEVWLPAPPAQDLFSFVFWSAKFLLKPFNFYHCCSLKVWRSRRRSFGEIDLLCLALELIGQVVHCWWYLVSSLASGETVWAGVWDEFRDSGRSGEVVVGEPHSWVWKKGDNFHQIINFLCVKARRVTNAHPGDCRLVS